MSIIQEALKKAQERPADEQADVQKKEAEDSAVFVSDIFVEKRPAPQAAWPASRRSRNKRMPAATVIAAAITAALIVAIAALALSSRNAGSKVGLKEDESAVSHQDVTYKRIAPDKAAAPGANVPAKAPDATSAPKLVLNGIMYIDENPRAIINNAIVRQGGTVAGATVLKINERSVILKNGFVEITLTLKE